MHSPRRQCSPTRLLTHSTPTHTHRLPTQAAGQSVERGSRVAAAAAPPGTRENTTPAIADVPKTMDPHSMMVAPPPTMDSQNYSSSTDGSTDSSSSSSVPLPAGSFMAPASSSSSFLFAPAAPAVAAAMPRAAGALPPTKSRTSSSRLNPNSDR